VKPVRIFKRLGAALAAGLLALGIIAGSASAANAGGSGELNSAGSGELNNVSTLGSGELN